MAAVEHAPVTSHILRGTAAQLAVTFYADGVASDPGVTTVTVARLDGSAIVTEAATVAGGTGERTYALGAAETTNLDILTVTWDSAAFGAVTQLVEIVGAFLFSLREARAFDVSAMANTAKYTTAEIEQARIRITDEFERICGVSFIPRVKRVELDGTGSSWLFLPDLRVDRIRQVESLDSSTLVWTAYTAQELASVQLAVSGRLGRSVGSFAAGRGNVRVTYEHGWTRPPQAISQAALTVCRYTLVPENYSQRTTSVAGEFGATAFATAGRVSNPWSTYPHYGLPQVDATLARYSEKRPVVA